MTVLAIAGFLEVRSGIEFEGERQRFFEKTLCQVFFEEIGKVVEADSTGMEDSFQ